MIPPSIHIGHLGSETLESGKGSNFSRFYVSKADTAHSCSSHRPTCNCLVLEFLEILYTENEVKLLCWKRGDVTFRKGTPLKFYL